MLEKKFLAGSISLAFGAISLYKSLGSFSFLFFNAGFFIIYFIIPLIAGLLLIRAYYAYIYSKYYFRNNLFFGIIFFIINNMSFIFANLYVGYNYLTIVNYFPAGIMLIISIIFFIFIILNWNVFEDMKKDI